MRVLILSIFFLLPLVNVSRDACACDTGTVRDAAFFSARDTFWIGMAFDSADDVSHARYQALSDWLGGAGASLNIQVEHILPDDSMYLRLRYGVNTPPAQIPVTYLAGRHPAESRPVKFYEWHPAPEISLFENMKTNPVFAGIARDTSEYWGVIVYARGEGASRRSEIEEVAATWKRNHAPGVSVLELDRNAAENEFLRAVLGIDAHGEDWAGVVFGKGRLLVPALVGSDITARELDRLLNRLMVPCTCIQQAAVFGFDLPLFWDEEKTTQYVSLEAPAGYLEMSLDDKLASVLTEMPSGARSVNTGALAVITGLGLIAAAVLSVVFWRLRTR